MIVICNQCNKKFRKSSSDIRRTRHNFCSQSCAGVFNGERRKGPYKNRNKLYVKARKLRQQGFGYKSIGHLLNIGWNTIRNWVCDIRADKKIARKKANYIIRPLNKLKSNTAIRNRLVNERGYRCESCSNNEWMSKPIVLEVHHKDGNKTNCNRNNLSLLCPNCHSLTDNYKNKGRKV